MLKDQRILNISQNDKIEFQKSIKFEKVCFTYDHREFIENLDLEIKKGSSWHLWRKWIRKKYYPQFIDFTIKSQKGSIYLDDKLIKTEINKRKFQNMIIFISQDTFLIEDTIKNNIIFNSDSKIDEERLDKVIKFSKIDKFIDQFSDGLDYMLGSHSRRISSGQRQRIAIARAIYNLKDLLIFDEATNALDEENERNN